MTHEEATEWLFEAFPRPWRGSFGRIYDAADRHVASISGSHSFMRDIRMAELIVELVNSVETGGAGDG